MSSPCAFGAAYCHPVEMWVANLTSFILPLFFVNAPSPVWKAWLVSGIMGTQHQHSGKDWPWSRYDHQPNTHDDHHRYVNRHFGNIGFF